MATITKTYTENQESRHSTWTIKLTGTNVTASSSSVWIPFPSMTAKFVYANKDRGRVLYEIRLRKDSSNLTQRIQYRKPNSDSLSPTSMTSGETYVVGVYDESSNGVSVNTSALFDSNNASKKSVAISVLKTYADLTSTRSGYDSYYDQFQSDIAVSLGDILTVTLNAPPKLDSTHNTASISYSTNPKYAGHTTATATIGNLSAQYGGSITKVTFTIGNQTVTKTSGLSGTFTMNIALTAIGSFNPTVTFTDSRGQTSTRTFSAITVKSYTKPSVKFAVERTTSTGEAADEGTNAVISPKFTFTDDIATLQSPTVKIDGTTVTPTWYSSRASDGTLSGSVNWGNLSSGATVYGLLSNNLDISKSYQVSITPRDNNGYGTTITHSIPTAYYTIDFLAGGHGIAFGQLATEEKFVCSMPAVFNNDITIQDHSSGIGAYYGYASTDTIASGTSFVDTGISMNLPKGRYIVEAYAGFGGNTTGFRGIRISASDDGATTDVATLSSQIQPALNNANWTNRLHTSAIIVSDNSDTTVKVQVLQNSGGNLSVTAQARWIRIR